MDEPLKSKAVTQSNGDLDEQHIKFQQPRPKSQELPRKAQHGQELLPRRPVTAGDQPKSDADFKGKEKKGLLERLHPGSWLWTSPPDPEESPELILEKQQQEDEQLEWEWQRHMEKNKQQDLKEHHGSHNLYRQWYYDLEDGKHQDSRWWILRSGMPFPSYHSNPTRNFPARAVWMEGAQSLCEELRAPRIRLAPQELVQRKHFLAAIQQKAEEVEEPPTIEALNLSYQNLGEEYQYEQLLAFLKINSGVRTLALSDNFLTDLQGINLRFLENLFLARNNIQSFQDIPGLPELRRLSVEENFISNFDGLTSAKFPKLTHLTIKLNPVAKDLHHRDKVKILMPSIRWLDGAAL